MKLVYVIVPEARAQALLDVVVGAGFRCTRFDSQGGFWRARNSTLLVGVEDARLREVLELIRTHVRPSRGPRPLPSRQTESGGGSGAGSEDSAGGHATVFVQEVERYERF